MFGNNKVYDDYHESKENLDSMREHPEAPTGVSPAFVNDYDPMNRHTILFNLIRNLRDKKMIDPYSYETYHAASEGRRLTRTQLCNKYREWIQDVCVYEYQLNETHRTDLIEITDNANITNLFKKANRYTYLIDCLSTTLAHHGDLMMIYNANLGKGQCQEISDLLLLRVGIGPMDKISKCKACRNFIELLCAAHKKFCEIVHNGDLTKLNDYIAADPTIIFPDDHVAERKVRFKPIHVEKCELLVEISKEYIKDDIMEKQFEDAKRITRRLNKITGSIDLKKKMINKFIKKWSSVIRRDGIEQLNIRVPALMKNKWVMKYEQIFATPVSKKFKDDFDHSDLKVLRVSEFSEFTTEFSM